MAQTLTYAQLVAQALPHRPEMLAVARDNVARWLATGHHPVAPLTKWDELLAAAQADPAALAAIVTVLDGGTAERSRLAEFSPFAGVLRREERREATDLCTWRH